MIVPYNLKQNGIAKRKNGSIVEVAHAMLHDQKLLKFLWGKQLMQLYMFKTGTPSIIGQQDS